MRFEKTDFFYKIPETNCIPELISDTDYRKLTDLGMIHNIRLRNYCLSRDYKDLITFQSKKIVAGIMISKYGISKNRLRRVYGFKSN